MALDPSSRDSAVAWTRTRLPRTAELIRFRWRYQDERVKYAGRGSEQWWRGAVPNSTPCGAPRARASTFRRPRPDLSSRLAWSIRRRSFRRMSGAVAASAAAVVLAACPYGFAGGTLPNVKTVA